MPLPPLLGAEAHPSRAKAGHIKCWHGMTCGPTFRGDCALPKSWRECLCKTQLWGALKFNLCSYSPSVCYYKDGEAEGQCRCLLWSCQALSGHEAAGRSSVACMELFLPSSPTFLVTPILERPDEPLLLQLQAYQCWAGSCRRFFWLKWGLQSFPGTLYVLKQFETFSC